MTQTFTTLPHKEREKAFYVRFWVVGRRKKRRREKKILSSKVSLFSAFCDDKKKEGERESERRKTTTTTTNRRRAHLVSSTVFPMTRRRLCSHKRVFVKTIWRKKKSSFFVYKQSKAQSYCSPLPSVRVLQDEKESTKDFLTKDGYYERVQSIDLFREVLEDSKKRKKKRKGPTFKRKTP